MSIQRCEELDIMKFWGILLVILGHVTNFYTSGSLASPAIPSTSMGNISTFVYLFHMPMFVFVSGAVYAFQVESLGRKSNLLTLIRKKSQRLLVPYICVGFLFLVPTMVGCHFREGLWNYAYQGILLSKDSRHLWFVLALFEIFILFWLLSKMVGKVRFPKWSLLLISFGGYLLSNYVPYIFQISAALKYLFWFTLGYEFMLYKKIIHGAITNYFSGGVILTMAVFVKINQPVKIPLFETIVAMIGIMLIYHIACDWKSVMKFKLFHVVNKNSYGLYLYHVIFIYLTFYILQDISIPPYILAPLVYVSSIVLSLLLTELTRMVNLQFIIGERRKNGK